jgi:lipopolysaccharide export system permease protein
MPVLPSYLIRQFLRHFALMLFAFVALLQLFDLLKNGNDVIDEHGGEVFSLVQYAGLRLPELVTFILPFAVLIGSLLTLAKFSHANEIVALKTTGRSLYRVMAWLAPAGLLIAVVQFVLADQLVPHTQRALDLFSAQSEERKSARAEQGNRAIWLREGLLLVRVDYVVDDGHRLYGVSLFERSEEGHLLGRISAEQAVNGDGVWTLSDVERLTFTEEGGSEFEILDTLKWDTALTPQQFKELSLPPSRLSLMENLDFIENPGYATHPPHLYRTWVHERLSAPFASLVMILLAAPVAGRLSRQGGMGKSVIIGVLLGFAYFISDGLLLAMGESGKIPPLLAAWTPLAAFASLGLAALLHEEGW